MTFEKLFKKHYPYVVKHIMRTVKNQEVAEDLAQEVFIQFYKTNWHQARVEKASLLAEPIEFQSLEDKWIRKEEAEGVRYVMEELQEQEQKLLRLRYSGLKYKEIAEIMGVEPNAIGTMLARAQKKFKKLYTNSREV